MFKKNTSNREKQGILLMIPNEEIGHFLAVKNLLRGITSKHHGDFYCLDYKYEKKYESHKKVFKNKDYCNVLMPSEDTKTLEINQY